MICKDYYVPMVGAISFSKDKHEKFCRYQKYYLETKHQKIKSNKLSFGEELNKAIHKRK